MATRATTDRRTAAASTCACAFLIPIGIPIGRVVSRAVFAIRCANEDDEAWREREAATMISASVVTIVVNGAIVAGVAPARIIRGRVVAPLTPVVVALGSRTFYDAAAATVSIERSGRRIVVPVVLVENSLPFVELGPIVRGMGGSSDFDPATKTLVIVMRPAESIATPTPFDGSGSPVAPRTVFTPAPPPATPRSPDTGAPRPRRTAIPVTPSQPIVPPPEATPTNRRR